MHSVLTASIAVMAWLEERIFQFLRLVEYKNQQRLWNAIEFLGDGLRTPTGAGWRLPDDWMIAQGFQHQPFGADRLIRNEANYNKLSELVFGSKVHAERYRADWEPVDDDVEFHEAIARLLDEKNTE